MPRIAILGAVLVLSFFLVTPLASSQTLTQGGPDFHIIGPEFGIHPGQTLDVTFHVQNDAEVIAGSTTSTTIDRITTARGVRVSVEDGRAPVTVQSGTIGLGNVPEGQTPITVRLTINDNAKPGEYELPVRIRYSATTLISEASGVHQEVTRTVTRQLPITIEKSSRFQIVNTTSDLRLGEQGPVRLEMRNTGEQTATAATVHLTPSGSALSFIDDTESVTAIGTWRPGETKIIPVDAQVPQDMQIRSLGIDVIVNYEDPNGVVGESR